MLAGPPLHFFSSHFEHFTETPHRATRNWRWAFYYVHFGVCISLQRVPQKKKTFIRISVLVYLNSVWSSLDPSGPCCILLNIQKIFFFFSLTILELKICVCLTTPALEIPCTGGFFKKKLSIFQESGGEKWKIVEYTSGCESIFIPPLLGALVRIRKRDAL